MLVGDRLLLIIDCHATLDVYVGKHASVHLALERQAPCKQLNKQKIGQQCLFTLDEEKQLLAVFAVEKFQLSIFKFDETFTSLKAWVQALNLLAHYNSGCAINHFCFVTGKEAFLFVDSDRNARIFSVDIQAFRPAILVLPEVPKAIAPSPDGSCFLALFADSTSDSHLVRAYHWESFGSTNGIDVPVDIPLDSHDFIITSFVNRNITHLLSFDPDNGVCRSAALDITKKLTEFSFEEKSHGSNVGDIQVQTVHNCLINCFSDVWTRFPVVPAVPRDKIFSRAQRKAKSVTFVANHQRSSYPSYFADMIDSFKSQIKKPTGDELSALTIQSISPHDFLAITLASERDDLSAFRMGEWMVNLLCLIPIHIAITRDNQFVPLKDGVISSEFEQSLLGAEVSTIVDNISLGWYESILRSYLSKKRVKVVSSMGEQSVGKSFALNHLVDTSFAGSAMRTTEGVWMSVTPCGDELLVALDFEGVHSVERSVQEDTLLVLFNAAISNLVLFRNNFTLSRDITELFRSFQSSANVFDPVANPTLFRSKLVIIIKDVVDGDKKEIVREFQLKFGKIVHEERASNFVSKLYRGQVKIVAWPVIESERFYVLFGAMKQTLDKQPATHANAGQFLHTLKTLMAKLKSNDWKALSQSLVAHRAHQLSTILPNALMYGLSSLEPEREPLKDLETDTAIPSDDTDAFLFLAAEGLAVESTEKASALRSLCQRWKSYASRSNVEEKSWIHDLETYIQEVSRLRLEHVKTWVFVNLTKFNATHENVHLLHRRLDILQVELNINLRLCKHQCANCQLSCLLPASHDFDEAHTCHTSHLCPRSCELVTGDHTEQESISCGYKAGHTGNHVCDVAKHLCGKPCDLQDKKGCLLKCSKVLSHSDCSHRCSSQWHACSKPCKLVITSVQGGELEVNYRCPGTCVAQSETIHDDHLCWIMSCPLPCGLCSRPCAGGHLHGLEEGTIHQCGEEHTCASLCENEGICEIDIAPQSIEETFTGRHETFHYTKYSQVAKHLGCAIPIPRGQQRHEGSHCHTLDTQPFHYCKASCRYCGYYCTLPMNHSQPEHETSHGSMSKTRWALEDPDEIVELNGHKFGAEDNGAPMMCSMYCKDMGRHVHIDFCRADDPDACTGNDLEHLMRRMNPNPDRAKDWITHELYWKRSGFRDPYSREDRATFAKCDSMCPGIEHISAGTTQGAPSYCVLPLFHPPETGSPNLGYLSNDGHKFSCKNPALLHPAFHIIFVIDRSSSMTSTDHLPLKGTLVTNQITSKANNRLGAVYSALYSFWSARAALAGGNARRDAYSVVLFRDSAKVCVENDLTSTPEQLLHVVLAYSASGCTSFDRALTSVEEVMQRNWNTNMNPIVIFLSDGEDSLGDATMRSFCRVAVSLGKPLSFQSVAFGPHDQTLRRMTQIALEVQRGVPHDPMLGPNSVVDSAFHIALDTVRLAETFLGIANSLKKSRAALVC